MKVFISQPMRGLSDEEIKSNRQKAIDLIMLKYNNDAEIIDSFIEDDAPKDVNPGAWYLGKSIEAMSMADVVVFLPGWEHARGCKNEHCIAVEYGFDVGEINSDYNKISVYKYYVL